MEQNMTLQGVRVAILATDGVEDVELREPRAALDQAGARTTLIAPKEGSIYSMKHHDKAAQHEVDMSFANAAPDEFDAVLLPGGALSADVLRMVPEAQEFVRQIDRRGKAVAVICHAPWLLISAGCVRGRKITSYYTIQDDLRNAGADWRNEEVVHDRNWVSSRQPWDIPAFNQAMVELFAAKKHGMADTTPEAA